MMQHWRWLVLVALVGTPVLLLVGFGVYHLWHSGLAFWVWWPLSACIVLAYVLAWRWQSQQRLLSADLPIPLHWTERDRQAWLLVEARAKQAAEHPSEQLTAVPFYVETAQAMALELARFYHPRAKDPVGSLTIPEILAVVELAAHDLAQMVDQYLPGGHLLTVNDLRRFKTLADWYPVASNISWLISGLFAPFNTAVRYVAVQAGMNRPWQMLQENLLVWFFAAYVHRLGAYLIDLNSGRLRVGAERYLALQKANRPGTVSAEGVSTEVSPDGEIDPADAVPTVTFAIVGQTKAGKSSLINALLGEQLAITDVVPATADIQRYELQPPGVPTRFSLLDTVGYGATELRDQQRRSMEAAARQADVMLLVLHARNPARQTDLDMLEGLHRFLTSNPDLRKPPVLAVLTHVDLLSPALEWSPPYNWQVPQLPKEKQIHEAVAAVQEQLGKYLVGVVPVCTAPGRVYGVDEWLLPALVGLLDQAHAVAFLRCLKAEINTGKVRKVFSQLLAVGKGMVTGMWKPTPAG
jgi:small GTP-binding protein